MDVSSNQSSVSLVCVGGNTSVSHNVNTACSVDKETNVVRNVRLSLCLVDCFFVVTMLRQCEGEFRPLNICQILSANPEQLIDWFGV